MTPNVGLNVTCNTNCSHWCPRILRVFCCCCSVDEKTTRHTDEVARKTFDKSEDSTISEDTSCDSQKS